MLDLQRRMQGQPDLRRFVWLLEEWIIRSLAAFGVQGERREGRVGIWVRSFNEGGLAPTASPPPPLRASHLLGSSPPIASEQKIAAIGIRIRRGVSYHGIAINVSPDLSHYAGIVPCGIREHGVTSLHALGKQVSMAELDKVLQREFDALPW
jgi:lipoyl(octanoyl) transferase